MISQNRRRDCHFSARGYATGSAGTCRCFYLQTKTPTSSHDRNLDPQAVFLPSRRGWRMAMVKEVFSSTLYRKQLALKAVVTLHSIDGVAYGAEAAAELVRSH